MRRLPTTAVLLCLLCLLWLWLPSLQAQTPGPSFNRNAPTARGLIGWWRAMPGFTGGRYWYDLTGRNHGTLVNMGTAGTTSGWAPSSLPHSFNLPAEMRFDGTNDSVQLTASALLQPPAFSLFVWVKATAYPDYAVLAEAHEVTSVNERVFFLTNAGRLAVYIKASGGDVIIDPSTTFMSAGLWYHVGYTYNQSAGLAVYLNCKVDGTAAPNGTLGFINTPFNVGSRAAENANIFVGALQDLRMYNRAVPQAEVCTIMREAQQGEPRLLSAPAPALVGLLGSVTVANPTSFLPFFPPQ